MPFREEWTPAPLPLTIEALAAQDLCSAITPSSSLWTLILAARIIVREHNLAVEGLFGNDTMHAPAPPCVVSHWHAADAAGRCRTVPAPLSASSSDTSRRKPLSAQT